MCVCGRPILSAGTRGTITFAFISLYLDGLKTTDDFTEMITAVRNICDKYVDLGLPNFPVRAQRENTARFWAPHVLVTEMF